MTNGADKESWLKELQLRGKGTFWEMLGGEIVEVSQERAVVALDAEKRHFNPMGMVHGGVTASLLDNAMGLAVLARSPGMNAVTTNLNVQYVAPVGVGRVTVTAHVLHASRSTVSVEGKAVDGEGNLCGIGTASFRLLPLTNA